MRPPLRIELGLNVNPNLQPVVDLDGWFRLGTDQLDGALLGEGVWFDVTDRVRGTVTFSRGRSDELDRFQTGTARFVLDNRDGMFDPLEPSSPFAGKLEPLRPVRMSTEVGNRSEPVWTGFVEDWQVSYDPQSGDATVTVPCMDGFGLLAAAELDVLPVESHSGDLSGQRVSRVLNRSEVSYPSGRDVDAGVAVLGATTFGENALDHLHQVVRSEDGWLFVGRDGRLTFRSRTSVLNRVPLVTFVSGHASGVRVADMVREDQSGLLYNRADVAGVSGVRQVVQDDESVFRFLPRTVKVDTLLRDDPDAEQLAHQLVRRLSVPQQRVRHVTVNLHDPRTAWPFEVATLDIADRVAVNIVPPGTSAVIVKAMTVDGVAHTVDPVRWTTTVTLSEADDRTFLVLDDAEFGMLDGNRLAF
jgi:hypothetical protein